MLCGWLSSSVARLVVYSMPPTFSSTRSDKLRGGLEVAAGGVFLGVGPAAAAAAAGAALARRGTLRGGLLLPPLPASGPHATSEGSPPPVGLTAPDKGRGMDIMSTRQGFRVIRGGGIWVITEEGLFMMYDLLRGKGLWLSGRKVSGKGLTAPSHPSSNGLGFGG